jgi:hypothetical protein
MVSRDDSLSRRRTATLLKRLRSLARETRTLKDEIDTARRDTLTRHSRSIDPMRARNRK